MKIAIFRTDCSTQDPATYNSQEMGLARALRSLGHSVDILMASGSDSYNERTVEKADNNIRIIEIPFRLIPLLNEPVYLNVGQILQRGKYDYVQINEEGNLASYLIARVCLKYQLKFGFYQGMYRVLSGRKWALYEAIHQKLFRPMLCKYATGVFCKTSEAKKFLEQRGYQNTHVMPVGLDFSRFQDRQDKDWRVQLNLSQGDQLVLYVGRLEDRRNPEFIAELASEVNNQVHFVLVGDGPSRSQVETIRNARSLNNLHLLGQLKQKELPALYEQADVFILPSNYEIYGMVIAESLFFGTPVVTTRTAGSVDIIENKLLGSIIPELEVGQWLKVLSEYSVASGNDRTNAERSAYAKEKFDWIKIAHEYLRKIEVTKDSA